MSKNLGIEDFGDNNLIRKFLLHQLDPISSEEVEERFFQEPEFKELVLMTEEEIMDDYLLERLSSDDRVRVQKYLLSSSHQLQKLHAIKEVVQTLNHFPSDEPLKPVTNKKGLFKTLKDFYKTSSKPLVFGSALLIICFSLIITIFFLRGRNDSLLLNAALLKKIELLNHENDSPENASSSVFELSRASRGADAQNNRIFIKLEDKIIEYHLAVAENQYQSYQVNLSKFNSPPLVTIKSLQLSKKNGATFLRVKFPAEVFENGFYQINVAGVAGENVEELGTVSFEVILSK
jgi:hypothetical protein